MQTGALSDPTEKKDSLEAGAGRRVFYTDKRKKVPVSPGFDSGSVLDRSGAAMCRLRTVKERRHLGCVFCSLMCPLRSVPSESASAIDT